MLSDDVKARIEHEVDSRSVGLGVWLYRRTRGRIVRLWNRRAIVLTTTGRRSGQPRTVIVQVFADGSDLLVVAANSGLPRPPGWCFNLRADPGVVGELDGHRLTLRAQELSETQAADRWQRVVLTTAPDYEKYERRTGRVPPMFRLCRPDLPGSTGPRAAVHGPDAAGDARSIEASSTASCIAWRG